MFLLFIYCLIVVVPENYGLKETLNKKNLQFVENLRQDLRRNNDDYAETKRNTSQTNSTRFPFNNINLNDVRYKIITTRDDHKLTNTLEPSNKIYSTTLKGAGSYNARRNNDNEDARIKLIDNIKRRVDDALISKEVLNKDKNPQRRSNVINDTDIDSNNDELSSDDNQPKARSLWNDMNSILQKNNDKLNLYRMKLLSNKTYPAPHTLTVRTTQTTKLEKNKKHTKKDKIEKFKKFIQKNKGLLREFMSSKKAAAIISPATPATPYTTTQRQRKTIGGEELEKAMRQAVDGLSKKKVLEELPNADMLDMFPAKGGRIHSKRVKGHLCHRHVLIPEGPKYNSLGHIYLPPHAAAHIAHEYNATEIPRLLLPKCCNCCHKSVLGCE